MQPRLKPGIAMSVVRECLAGLAALHREGIVHGDLKPSNVMLKRTGNAKIVDIGSAFEIDNAPAQRTCTPTYTPRPRCLEGEDCSPRSDLASLGYVLIELLAGYQPSSVSRQRKSCSKASARSRIACRRFCRKRWFATSCS